MINPFMYYVYSLKCKDGYYVYCTGDLKERFFRHVRGMVPATAKRLPVRLNFYFAVKDQYIAFRFEKYLKSGFGRAFVKKIFNLNGRVAEWSNATVLKTVVPQGTVGSNPTPSARLCSPNRRASS